MASLIDVIRTRVMNASASSDHIRSPLSAARSILLTEGFSGFFKGIVPYYVRVGPHVTCMFIAFEQCNRKNQIEINGKD